MLFFGFVPLVLNDWYDGRKWEIWQFGNTTQCFRIKKPHRWYLFTCAFATIRRITSVGSRTWYLISTWFKIALHYFKQRSTNHISDAICLQPYEDENKRLCQHIQLPLRSVYVPLRTNSIRMISLHQNHWQQIANVESLVIMSTPLTTSSFFFSHFACCKQNPVCFYLISLH